MQWFLSIALSVSAELGVRNLAMQGSNHLLAWAPVRDTTKDHPPQAVVGFLFAAPAGTHVLWLLVSQFNHVDG
ncbi:hypothetical protein JB92DRAFT_2844186 [Gautieria morchelliformis]|nr:hypothetical protein JB92DRAFT_2844186 [Gautieria morchelliformis]